MFDRLFRRKSSTHSVDINAGQFQLAVKDTESLLQAALNAGIPFPHNCRIGGCGECKCKLLSGKVKEQTDKSYLLSAEELKQNYILACQSLPRSDVSIEVTLREAKTAAPIVEVEGHISGIRPLTHDIVELSVALQQPMRYAAGQYAELELPAGSGPAAGQPRSYSFTAPCLPADGSTALSFYVRKVPGGAFTGWLFEADRRGAPLKVRGPYGDFGLRSGNAPLLCIAGGSGLGPIKAMLEQAVADRAGMRDVVVVLGVRTQADLYGQEELDAVRRQWSARFEFVPVLSAEPEGSNWSGRRGFAADQLDAIVGNRLGQHQAYMCGPPQMIDSCVARLQAAGVPASEIFFDKFLDRSHMAQA